MPKNTKSTNNRTRALAMRKKERARPYPYSERVQPVAHALATLGGRATSAELFAKLRTGKDGLFEKPRRINATWRQHVRHMDNPPYVFDGKYFVLTKRQRRIPSSKSKRSNSNRKQTRSLGAQERSTGRSSRQGFNLPADAQRAIEDLAMKRATAHFIHQGWKVEDVSPWKPYDLCCLKRNQELHVEVKGTSSAGKGIDLTHNAVLHARRYFPNVALYVLADVVWKSSGDGYRAKGGRKFIYNPWRIDDGKLKPRAYTYKLPETRPDRSLEATHARR